MVVAAASWVADVAGLFLISVARRPTSRASDHARGGFTRAAWVAAPRRLHDQACRSVAGVHPGSAILKTMLDVLIGVLEFLHVGGSRRVQNVVLVLAGVLIVVVLVVGIALAT